MKNCSSGESPAREVGDRLRDERLRLGYTQGDFAQAGGVNRNTQGSYERGERYPDTAYLLGVAGIGVDVGYVVTGQKAAVAESSLNEVEQELLGYFRTVSDYNKETIRRMVFAIAAADGGLDSEKT
ncbi:helix-turn-helix domain-containing protein [Pseudomonas oryzihabitans]|uniref:helix-turn-helix domain-containing protein n=1 Tax=Pseudomonas oryzihabitans TaxID=47885 RepID=UPI0009438EB0|nr:helix-turn-helix domain-containing protein [Pseudomonas psychrotolerans]NMY88959.1 helix-turn-helix transcriptional regulator [Pseudomonas psychrotolerans]